MLRLLPGISSLIISTLSVRSPAFTPNLSRFFPLLAVANTGSCVGLQDKIGHPAHRYRQLMQVPGLSARGISIGSKTCFWFYLGLRSKTKFCLSETVWCILCNVKCVVLFAVFMIYLTESCGLRKSNLWYMMTCGMNTSKFVLGPDVILRGWLGRCSADQTLPHFLLQYFVN